MGKKSKVQGPSIDWFSVGIVIARTFMALFIIYLGFNLTDSGERVYNMYMHAARKMVIPGSKPGDASPLGMSWNDLNKAVILGLGALAMLAGVLIFAGMQNVSALILAVCAAFFAATKDNHWIESDVSAIKREKNVRLEHMLRDLSLFGVCLMMLSGFGAKNKLSDKVQPQGEEEAAN